MKAVDILRDREITGTYKTKLRLAVECEFWEAFHTVNPIARKLGTGFELWLRDGTREIVSDDFEVLVYEVKDGWKPIFY